MTMTLAIRPIQIEDLEPLTNYWLNSSDDRMIGMGVDLNKLPSKSELKSMMGSQIDTILEHKKSYALIWLLDNIPVGHCNVNQIQYGQQAYMHLHLWQNNSRKRGLGSQFVKLSIPQFFKDLKLQRLFCEPYALNPAPNKTLEKIGITFVKEHICTPGYLNFEQPVKRWVLNKMDLPNALNKL